MLQYQYAASGTTRGSYEAFTSFPVFFSSLAAENVFLQAVSLELGTVVIGAFHDEEVKAVLHLRGQEEPLYLMPVGKK